jgi:hypothetical protein
MTRSIPQGYWPLAQSATSPCWQVRCAAAGSLPCRLGLRLPACVPACSALPCRSCAATSPAFGELALPGLQYLPCTACPVLPAVEDDKFWEDVVPLELGDLPALQVGALACPPAHLLDRLSVRGSASCLAFACMFARLHCIPAGTRLCAAKPLTPASLPFTSAGVCGCAGVSHRRRQPGGQRGGGLPPADDPL